MFLILNATLPHRHVQEKRNEAFLLVDGNSQYLRIYLDVLGWNVAGISRRLRPRLLRQHHRRIQYVLARLLHDEVLNVATLDRRVECAMCGLGFMLSEAGLGYNMGKGPEYCCRVCAPPTTVEKAVETIKTFIKGSA